MEIGRYVACFLRSGESLINTRVVWFVTDCRGAGRKKRRERRKGGRKESSDKRSSAVCLEKNELV